MKTCKLCGNDFKGTVSYQIYCSTNCRDLATKEKIAERHRILRIKKRRLKKRFCVGGCGKLLSVYNDNKLCDSCHISKKDWNKVMKEIRNLTHEYEDDTK